MGDIQGTNTLDKKALNLEMLKIAGFICTGGIWSYPDGVDVDNGVPFFPDDFNACLKWLVPEFERIELWQLLDKSYRWEIVRKRDNLCSSYFWGDKNLVLAFCLAVRKLINDED